MKKGRVGKSIGIVFISILLCGTALAQPLMIENGLVSYWQFDNGAADSIGNNDGTIYGAASVTGKIGNALKFDGVNDYVEFGDIDAIDLYAGQDVTWAGWFKINPNNKYGVIMDKREYSDDGWNGLAVWRNPSNNHIGVKLYANNNSFAISGSSITTQGWHYVAVVCDRSDTMVMYIDGVVDGSVNISSFASLDLSTDADFTIGKRSDSRSIYTPFNGMIDDVAVYNRALSAQEVYQIYSVPEPATLLLLGFGFAMLRKNIKKTV